MHHCVNTRFFKGLQDGVLIDVEQRHLLACC